MKFYAWYLKSHVIAANDDKVLGSTYELEVFLIQGSKRSPGEYSPIHFARLCGILDTVHEVSCCDVLVNQLFNV